MFNSLRLRFSFSKQSFESSGARQTTKPGQSAIDSDLAEILGTGADNKRRIPSRTIAPAASSNQTPLNINTEKSRGSNLDDLLRDLNDVRLDTKSSSRISRYSSDISSTSVPRSNSISSKTFVQLNILNINYLQKYNLKNRNRLRSKF